MTVVITGPGPASPLTSQREVIEPAGIRINWERAGVLVFAQLLPLFSKLVVSVFGAL